MLSGAIKKTKSAPRSLLFISVCLVIGLVVLLFLQSRNFTHSLRIKNTELKVAIADSNEEKATGLCCRDSLLTNTGMLFVYDEPGIYQFWMKDTRIPLDMYWLNSDKKIIHIEENVQPSSYPRSFGPDAPAQYVLETNAGFARRYNITVGDSAQF